MSAIIIPEKGEPYKTFYDVTAAISGGRTLVVQPTRRQEGDTERGGVSMYIRLAGAVSEILQDIGETDIIQR